MRSLARLCVALLVLALSGALPVVALADGVGERCGDAGCGARLAFAPQSDHEGPAHDDDCADSGGPCALCVCCPLLVVSAPGVPAPAVFAALVAGSPFAYSGDALEGSARGVFLPPRR